jgi:hypothetical protein
MLELNHRQMEILQRLVEAGLRPIAIPPYESALCLYRGVCAVVLAPVENDGLKVLAPASILVDGHFAVRIRRAGGDVFVWKQAEVPATDALLSELLAFNDDLQSALTSPPLI